MVSHAHFHLTCGAQSEPMPARSGASKSYVCQLSNELLRKIVGAQDPSLQRLQCSFTALAADNASAKQFKDRDNAAQWCA